MIQELNELLDSVDYLESGDGKPYTPREHFEETYQGVLKEGLIWRYREELKDDDMTQEEYAELEAELTGATPEETAYNAARCDVYGLIDFTLMKKESK